MDNDTTISIENEDGSTSSYYGFTCPNFTITIASGAEEPGTIPLYDRPGGESNGSLSPVNGDSRERTYQVSQVAFDLNGNEWWYVTDAEGNCHWMSASAEYGMDPTCNVNNKYTDYIVAVQGSEEYKKSKELALAAGKKVKDDLMKKMLQTDDPNVTNLNEEFDVGSGSYSLVNRVITQNGTYADYDRYVAFLCRVFGVPPQWNVYTDPPVATGGYFLGRKYSQVILANPTIVSICPGEMIFSESIMENLSVITDKSNDSDIINAFTNNGSDMLWSFKQRYEETGKGGYLDYVNAMCKFMVMALSNKEDEVIISDYAKVSGNGKNLPLKDRLLPPAFNISQSEHNTYKDIHVQNLLGSDVVNTGSSSGLTEVAGNNFVAAFANFGINVLNTISDTIVHGVQTAGTAVGKALTNRFVHFAVNGQVSIRESFSTETRASSIETTIMGSINEITKDLAFISGGVYTDAEAASDIAQLKAEAESQFGSGIGHILSNAFEVLKGGNMSWPQVLDSVSWGRDHSFSVRFVSIYGDVESRFLNVLLPYACLMCLWLPKQLKTSMDMYRLPFVVQAYAKGVFACPAGVVTNVEVIRGGDEETGWTGGGHPTEITVNFTIKPLHMKLMMSEKDPFFVKNVGLTNYLGTICGVDYTEPQTDLIARTAKLLFEEYIDDFPSRLEASFAQYLHDNKFLRFMAIAGDVVDTFMN